ncbi:MAG: hypothetical protein ACRDU5_16425 [Mycobacterium sp.]
MRLSEIRNWDTDHLTAGASRWTSAAASWTDAFTVASREARSPGGTDWEGIAAEAAQSRAEADRIRVLGLSDVLNELATTARTGAADVIAARQRVLAVVARADEAGFDVRDDLSVVSRASTGPAGMQAARQAQSHAIAADLGTAASALTAVDRQIAARLSGLAAALDQVQFAESVIPTANPAAWFDAVPESVWTIKCVAATGGGWDCNFRVDNGWYTEHFYVPP